MYLRVTIGASMCLSYYTLRRTSHTWNSSPVLTDYWKTVVSHCRLPESGAVQHQGKTQRQTLAERYEDSVFRLTPCTVICLVATTAGCFVKIAVIDHFRRRQAPTSTDTAPSTQPCPSAVPHGGTHGFVHARHDGRAVATCLHAIIPCTSTSAQS